jgi:hypothetical protein
MMPAAATAASSPLKVTQLIIRLSPHCCVPNASYTCAPALLHARAGPLLTLDSAGVYYARAVLRPLKVQRDLRRPKQADFMAWSVNYICSTFHATSIIYILVQYNAFFSLITPMEN